MATLLDMMQGMDGGQPNQAGMQAPYLNGPMPSMRLPQQVLSQSQDPSQNIMGILQSLMGSQVPQQAPPANIQVPFYGGQNAATNLNQQDQSSPQQAPIPANTNDISSNIQQWLGAQDAPQQNTASDILSQRFAPPQGSSMFANMPTSDQLAQARQNLTAAPTAGDYANSISSIITGKYQTGQDIADTNQQNVMGDLSKLAMAPLQTQLLQSEIVKNNAQGGGLFNTPGGVASNGMPQQLTGDAYLQTLPPAAAAQVKAASEGKMQLTPMLARSPYGQQLLSAIAQYDPTFDTNDYTKRAETVKAFAPGGKMGQNVTRIDTAINTLGQLSDVSDKIGGVNDASVLTGPMNSLSVFAKGAENDPNLRTYNTLAKTAADEVAAAVGGGSSAEGDRVARMTALDPGQSPDARKAAIKTMINELNSRLDPVAQAYTDGLGKPISSGIDLLTPSTQNSYRKIMGISSPTVNAPSTANNLAQKTGTDIPGASQIQEGATATNPQTGERRIFQNGAWRPM